MDQRLREPAVAEDARAPRAAIERGEALKQWTPAPADVVPSLGF